MKEKRSKRNVCVLKDRCIFGDNCPGTIEDLKVCAPIMLKAKKGICKYCGNFVEDLFKINQDYEVCFCCFKNLIEFELLKSELSFSEIKNIIERMRPQKIK